MRLVLLVLLASGASAQPRSVTFTVETPGVLAPLDTVFLAGTVNGWNPGDGQGDAPDMGAPLPMEPLGNGRFTLTLTVDGPAEYKYTLGSWTSVEKNAATGEVPNRALGAAASEARDTVAAWAVPSVALGRWRPDDTAEAQFATLMAFLAEHPLSDSLTTAQADARVAGLDAAWARDARAQGYPEAPVLPAVLGPFVYGRNRAVSDHVLTAHVLPRVRALLDDFERSPVVSSRAGMIFEMVLFAVEMPLRLDAPETRRLAGDADRIAALAGRYCDAARQDFPDVADAPCRARDDARRLARLWALRRAAAEGRWDEATTGLAEALRTADADDFTVALVAQRVARTAPPEHRLRVLDMLLTTTTDRVTNTDSLRAEYVLADPAGGPARFERLLRSRPAFRLDPMPDPPRLDGIVMPDLTARAPFDLSALRGRLVLIDVWTTWCGPCVAEIPDLNALHAAMAGRTDVAFVSLLADANTGGRLPPEADPFVREHGVAYPVLYDLSEDSLREALGVEGYPTRVLVYPDGSVRRVPFDVSWRTALGLATAELGLPPVEA